MGLYIIPANPKVGFTLFTTSLILLLLITSTTQSTSSQKPLTREAEANKIIPEDFLGFLNIMGMVEVTLMLPTGVELCMPST